MGTSDGAKKGWTEERRQRQAETMRQRAQDPEYRSRVANGVRKSQASRTPEERSESARKSHTPESDSKRAEAMRDTWQNTDLRARREVTEAQPETKARRSAAAREINSRPGRAEHQAELMREKFSSDEEFRERHSASLRKIMEDPAQRESRSVSAVRAWQENPEAFEGSVKAFRDEARSEKGRARRRGNGARRAAAAPVTPYEHKVALALNELEIPYFIHKVIGDNEYDIIVPSHHLNIEVDGSNHLGESGRSKDAIRDQLMTERGYTVLRLPHPVIKSGAFIAKLREALEA